MIQENYIYWTQKLQNAFALKLNSPNLTGIFLRSLQKNFDSFALFGGVCRDMILDKRYKDIDIVVDSKYPKLFKTLIWNSIPHIDIKYCEIKYNSFGGITIDLDSNIFDIWDIRDTYAFKKGQFIPSWKDLLKSVPFNIDSIIILNDGTVMEGGLFKSLESKTIDWLNKENLPDEKNIVARALKFEKKYGFLLSDSLKKFCDDFVSKNPSFNDGENKKISSMKEGAQVTYIENNEIPY